MDIIRKNLGTQDGKDIVSVTLKNKNGMEVALLNIGTAIQKILLPTDGDEKVNVVLGYPDWESYIENSVYFGVTAGRFANRIAEGKFTLDGVKYSLPINNPPNSLHGGNVGFSHRIWDLDSLSSGNENVTVTFVYTSEDGEEGYPGEMRVSVQYMLNNKNELKITYSATCDKKSIINLTNHSYFNLAGDGSVLDHILTIQSDAILPINSDMIPTGEIMPVDGTPFDFREPKRVGKSIKEPNQQLQIANGYDHCYVLSDDSQLATCAVLEDSSSGRRMEVDTTEPGVQLYTGNFIGGTKGFREYSDNDGLCLETQNYPDAPNHPEFPSAVIEPGQDWKSTTVFRFSF